MSTNKSASFSLLAIIALFAASLVTPVHAVASESSVFIDTPVLSVCGEHFIAFSGTATYGEGAHQLLVSLDSTLIYSTLDKPASWGFLHKVSAGTHTLSAQVRDAETGATVDHAINFEVVACASSGGDSDSNGGGGGDEGPDCCPGPDSGQTASASVSTPTVKGATTSSNNASLQDLGPLNNLFRTVFGRNPTFIEWEYWAGRFLSDKPAWDRVLGAMQWHKLLGSTIGQ